MFDDPAEKIKQEKKHVEMFCLRKKIPKKFQRFRNKGAEPKTHLEARTNVLISSKRLA